MAKKNTSHKKIQIPKAKVEVLDPEVVDLDSEDEDLQLSPHSAADGEIIDADLDPEILSKKSEYLKKATDVIRNYKQNLNTPKSTAIVSTDAMSQYMAEVKRYRLLTKEEERALAIRYHETHDSEAAEILVKANLRFVVKVASEYAKFGSKLIELVQEGNVGLMHAVKEYNPYKGARLITYAVWWIRGYIQEYLMKQYSMVKIGTTQNQRKLFYQLQRAKDEIDQYGYKPVIEQLSSQLGIDVNEVEQMSQRMSSRDVSLDQPIDDDQKGTLMDLQSLPDDTSMEDVLAGLEEIHLLNEKIQKLRPELTEKELYILENRLLADEPLSLAEIGRQRGVSREAVRQMETRILEKIKKIFLEQN